MYHSIEDSGPEALAPYRVPPALFESQLRCLAERGYQSVTLEDWTAAMQKREPLSKRSVIITFDDGYRNFLDNAWPLLERFGFTATMFVVTDRVGLCADWDDVSGSALPLMNWDELRQLRDRGLSIGSHTATHASLPKLSTTDIIAEGTRARERLREKLGLDVKTIAFPWGHTDARVCDALVNAGYRIGVQTWGGPSTFADNPMNLPRIEVFPGDTPPIFAQKLGHGTLPPMTNEPQNSLQLAAQLDRLIGQFVSLSTQLLDLNSDRRGVQARLNRVFREPLTGSVTRELYPYDRLASGMCMGFENGARVSVTVQPKLDFGTSPEDCVNTLKINFAGPSRYLSFEFGCDWEELTSITRYQLGIYGTANYVVPGRAVLRFPTQGDSFKDVLLAEYTLSSDRRNFNQSGTVPGVDFISLDPNRKPTILFEVATANLADLDLRLDYLSLFFD